MGSYPALHVNPPVPQENPLEQYGKVLQLKSLMQGQQMQNIQVQQAKQQQKDQQTVMQALGQTGGNMDAALPMLAGKVTPSTYATIAKSNLDAKKELAEYDDKTFKLKQEKHAALADVYAQANNLSDDQYAQAWPQIAARANELEPKLKLDPNQPVPKPALQQLGIGLSVSENYLKGEADKRAARAADDAAKKNEAELTGQQAQSTEKQLSATAQWMNGVRDQATWTAGKSSLAKRGTPQDILDRIPDQYSPEAADAVRQMGITPQQAANAPLDKAEAADWTKKNPGKGLSDFMAYKAKLVPAFNFNLQQGGAAAPATPKAADGTPLTGNDLYKSFGAKGAMVKSIIEGRQTMPAGFALKSPYWQDVMNKVYQADPQFSEQRAQIRKAFTTGKAADNIGSLNTATVHLDALGEAAKALENGSFTPGNAVYNSVSKIFGSKTPTDFASLKAAVSGEMANAMKGNATDIEIRTIGTALDAANSPGQLGGVVDHFLGLNFQKLNTYKERLEQQIPGDTAYSPVLPSAAKVFEKHGIGGDTSGSQLPAQAAAQLQEGHETTFANGQSWTLRSGKPARIR